ncbi:MULTISPECIES: arginase family protein [unclassified Streptomyces]|uniref:arginase family protein n=1 Tax=unclassified Streptomyces TaxID=2593676 RepID=UPI00365FC107
MPRVQLIGVPFNSAGKTGGVADGPHALRQVGVGEAFRQAVPVDDVGDLRLLPASPKRQPRSGLRNESTLVHMVGAVHEQVLAAYRTHHVPVLLGGDCAILLGALAAARDHADGPVGLVFVDGHEDAWLPHASTTGEAADTELGMALSVPGSGAATGMPAELAALLPLVEARQVAVLGVRDAQELDKAGVPRLTRTHPQIWLRTDRDLLEGDLDRHADEALAHIRRAAPGWWLHTDLDVLATDALPAVDYPQPGGLQWSHLTELTRRVLARPGCLGWTLTIYNPDLDPEGVHGRRICAYVADVAGALAERA